MRLNFLYSPAHNYRYRIFYMVYITILLVICIPQYVFASTVSSSDSVYQADSLYNLFNELSRQILAHNTFVTIDTYKYVYNYETDDLSILSDYYLHQNLEEPLLSGILYDDFVSFPKIYITNTGCTGDCEVHLEIQISYKYGKDKMDTYFQHMENIAKKLKTDNDYESIKAAYDYIINMVEYDYSYKIHTDYEGYLTGKMVCQGYSLALYRLLGYMDIPVLYIRGYVNIDGYKELHAWNMVKLDDCWYNVDATWDDTGDGRPMAYTYFLKNNEEFTNHYLHDDYSHYGSYIATDSYPLPPDLVKNDSLSQTNPDNTADSEVYVDDGHEIVIVFLCLLFAANLIIIIHYAT